MATIRVLMVDDQRVILAAVQQMLAHHPEFEIRVVSDPGIAVAQALEFEPAVILQDLVMDGLDGIALLKRYRAHPSLTDVPVVMLSAAEEPETKVEAFRCGANDYVVKLPSALELAARLRYHGRAYHNACQRQQAFQALLESRAALQERQSEIERQKAQLEVQARQLEAVNRELADSALSDALTGLRNRRYLRVYLDRAPEPAGSDGTQHERRHDRPRGQLTYFLFDLDHFKQINDRHGHDIGDTVLVEVARRMRLTIRGGDAAMRWGGEEFLIVARGLDAESARALAERILRAIADVPITAPGRDPLRVTASLGYAPSPWGNAVDGDAADDSQLAISLADAATYIAKLAGRNRACGVLPGLDSEFRRRLASINLGPGELRSEDGRGVQLVEIPGPLPQSY
jgi:two-component system, chemotaxis family, response regulator WspR